MNTTFRAAGGISAMLAASQLAWPQVMQTEAAANPAAPVDETTPAAAARHPEDQDLLEVIVTARKRTESDLQVPIAMTVVGSDELARRNINNLSDLAASTPNLNISTNNAPSGGGITLRGVGAGATGSFTIDQAVALNLDGITATNGSAINFSQFDLSQIEILKGPQSLYYGKNSSGGVISLTSADPTPEFYSMARVGYEFNADQLITEGVISGPLADGISGRLAIFRSDLDGYFYNPLPPGTVDPAYGVLGAPTFPRVPQSNDFATRGTLKLRPSDSLDIKFKLAYAQRHGSPSNAEAQLFYCPTGHPQSLASVSGVGDCALNHTSVPVAPVLSAAQTGVAAYGDGSLFSRSTQWLGAANVDYAITDALQLSSITGLYAFHIFDRSNATYATAPIVILALTDDKHDYSEELRLTSAFDSPLNFMVGGFVSTGTYSVNGPTSLDPTDSGVQGFPLRGSPLDISVWDIHSKSFAGFGQAIWKITDQVELAAGARYTSEKKNADVYGLRLGPIAITPDSRTFNSLSPDVTLSYRPAHDLNLYASYKGASKSGGFNTSAVEAPPFNQNFTFGDEKAKGFEVGLKSMLLDRALRFDLNAYRYIYSDLQVAAYDPQAFVFTVRNAASSKVQGMEATTTYEPPVVRGLSLSASENYNQARYQSYLGPCYVGQTLAEGCNILTAGRTIPSLENYRGKPLSKAPDWTGSLQSAYEGNLGIRSLHYGLSLSATYSSSYFAQSDEPPASKQADYWLLDGQIRLYTQDNRWELALTGRNLTNVLRVQTSVDPTFSPPYTVNPGTGTAVGHQPDLVGYLNRPRSIELRLTARY